MIGRTIMEEAANIQSAKKSNFLINTISFVVPALVVALLALPKVPLGEWTRSLPHVTGTINSLTTVALILGLVFIKLKNIKLHQAMMTLSFGLGGLFLICYVLYHVSNPANKFNGEGAIKTIYLFILFTHIGFSFVVLPLVLRAMYFAATRQFAAHKRIVRFAYPIWLYVSATGVLVYLFVYQLFPAK